VFVAVCRLLDGNLLNEGRLEGLMGGFSFVPFSADDFDVNDAAVACFTLGFG